MAATGCGVLWYAEAAKRSIKKNGDLPTCFDCGVVREGEDVVGLPVNSLKVAEELAHHRFDLFKGGIETQCIFVCCLREH